MNLSGRSQTKWVALVGTVLFFALVFVFAMLMHGLTSLSWGTWHAVINVGLLFAVLGAFYGAIAGLDSSSGMSSADRPLLRTILCGSLGATAVLLVQAWPPQSFNIIGPSLGFLIGAPLGWLGWRWAKFVDF
jgi:uncharacterized integral membrane protein